MRWTNDFPDIGDTRKREGFLWFPKTINGEMRWLEHARWEECWGRKYPPDHPEVKDKPIHDLRRGWTAFRWLPRNTGTSPAAKPDPPYKRPQRGYKEWQRPTARREEVRLRGGPDGGRVIEAQTEPPFDSSPPPLNCSTHEYKRTDETDDEGRPIFRFVNDTNPATNTP